jgi:protein-S-isoprenylcysteine O-methyltransferase Ste14
VTQSADRRERPNSVPWPPIILACAVAGAAILEYVYPLSGILRIGNWASIAGLVLVFTGLALDVLAMREMRRRRANILPHRAATALVTSGPFTLSRNPIYLGNTLLLTGAAFLFGSLWLLLTTAASCVAITHLAIRREEGHMAARFGDAWADYAKRTPRWIGVPF